MKILMLVPLLPNIQMSGGQTRWYNIIRHLSKQHDLTLVTFIKDDSEEKYVDDLKKYCKKILIFRRPSSPWTLRNLFLATFSFFPLLVIRNWSPKAKKAIKKEVETGHYDIIHAEAFYVMPHLPKTPIVPTILVEQTIEYLVYKHYVDNEVPWFFKPVYLYDIMKLRFWEQYYWKKAHQLVAVSDEDRKIMKKQQPNVPIDIIPNGVDWNYYANYKISKKDPPRVMYGVTNFEWLQNIEAVDILINDVWPLIGKRVKDVKLWIVGRKIPHRLVDLASKRQDIEVTESIPDARDAYSAATVMVTPIKGSGGTRLKILEAMAAGLPIVSTSVGVAGLNVEHEKHVLVSDNYAGLAKETVRLLSNKKLYEKIMKNGQYFVRERFDWESIVKLHDDIYKKVIEKNKQ